MIGILVMHEDDSLPPLAQWLDGMEAKSLLYMETVDGRQTRSPPNPLRAHRSDAMRP